MEACEKSTCQICATWNGYCRIAWPEISQIPLEACISAPSFFHPSRLPCLTSSHISLVLVGGSFYMTTRSKLHPHSLAIHPSPHQPQLESINTRTLLPKNFSYCDYQASKRALHFTRRNLILHLGEWRFTLKPHRKRNAASPDQRGSHLECNQNHVLLHAQHCRIAAHQ